MQIIFCEINMFDQDAYIYVPKDGNIQKICTIPMDNIAQSLVNLCYTKNIYDLELLGNSDYINGIIPNIRQEENIKYSINKIKIGVNSYEDFFK